MTDLVAHWDAAYAEGDARKSWTQDRPVRSLAEIAAVAPDPAAPVLDVGGGSSSLAAGLVAAGRTDVTVLDLSAAALELARSRMGQDAARVRWVAGDLLDFDPGRTFAVWHDRAVLHFLTDDADRARYAAVLRHVLAPGGHAIIATFAPDGPERCSGLPVRRSAPEDVLALLGPGFTAVREAHEVHHTPSGTPQAFAWLTARRDG
jgi:SAM-dependent methyltransferase